jgi:hypothetical protein
MENDVDKKVGRPKGSKNEKRLMKVPLFQYADNKEEIKFKALSLAFDTAHKLGYFKSPDDYDVNKRSNESWDAYNKRMENANFMKDIGAVHSLADLNLQYILER